MTIMNYFEVLTGQWTYRSFRNVVEPVEKLEDILFGEGSLRLEVPEGGCLRQRLSVVKVPNPLLGLSKFE